MSFLNSSKDDALFSGFVIYLSALSFLDGETRKLEQIGLITGVCFDEAMTVLTGLIPFFSGVKLSLILFERLD